MRLFKRGDTWYVEIERNRRRSLKTGDEREARRIYREIKRQYIEGRLLKLDPGRRITLREFKEEYLEHRQGKSKFTARQDGVALRVFEQAIGPTTPLRLINTRRIDEFKSICLARGVKPVSINNYLRHIRSALKTAVKWQYLTEMPDVSQLRIDQKAPPFLAPEEIDLLFNWACLTHPDLHRLLVFYLWTGARRTEALNLQWKDVRLDIDDPNCTLRKTKGKKDRTIPLLPPVVRALRPVQRDIGPVFVQVHPDTVSDWVRDLGRDLDIKVTVHMLRHTAGTYMAANGIPLPVIQELLGHADIITTRKYTHIITKRLYDEAEKLKFDL